MPTAKQVRMRRGTTLDNDLFTGKEGEITIDTTVKTIRVHDEVTPGGHALALADLSNISEETLKDLIRDVMNNTGGEGGEGEPMAIGDIKMSYAAQDPAEFHRTDGSTLSKTEYADLYELIGDRYNLSGVGATPFIAGTMNDAGGTFGAFATDGTNAVIGLNNGYVYHSNDNFKTFTYVAVSVGNNAATNRVLYFNNKFLAIVAGTTWSSTDGLTWTSATNTLTSVSSVYNSGGKLMVLTGSTAIAYSNDGATWVSGTFSTYTPSYLYYNARLALYFACSTDGKIYSSPDFTTWTGRQTTARTSYSTKNIIDNGSLLVAFGTASSTVPGVQTSPDGVTWTLRTPIASTGVYGLIWSTALSKFVGFTQSAIIQSSDGITWTNVASSTYGLATIGSSSNDILETAQGIYILATSATSSSILFAESGSTDFTLKNQDNAYFANYRIGSSLYQASATDVWILGTGTYSNLFRTSNKGANWRWLAIGASGSNISTKRNSIGVLNNNVAKTISLTPAGTMVVFEDYGLNYTAIRNTNIGFVSAIQYADGKYVAVGYHGMTTTSTNLTSWTQSSSIPAGEHLVALKYANGLWLTVSHSGKVYSSTNGSTWTYRATVLSVGAVTVNWTILYENGSWMITNGSTSIATSSDLTNWVTSNFTNNILLAAAGDGKWVLMSTSATYASDDLVVWIPSATPTVAVGNPTGVFTNADITFGNGQFVIGGGDTSTLATTSYAVINTSADGVSWSQTVLPSKGYIKKVTYGDGFFFAMGDSVQITGSTFNATNTAVYSSQDGFRWTLAGNSTTNLCDEAINIPGYGYMALTGNNIAGSYNFVLPLPEEGYFRLPLKNAESPTDGDYYIKIADPE